MSIHVVVMGVAGSGKSTVSEAIRDQLGFDMAEGDDFHPQHNIDKMTAGIPLTDEDRWPWLRVINTWMVAKDAIDHNSVVSSSALKRSYRDVLRDGVDVFFVHLAGDFDDVYTHMKARQGHFMPVSLLKSQYEDLQPLEADEHGVVINVAQPVEDVIAQAIDAVTQYQASTSNQAHAPIRV